MSWVFLHLFLVCMLCQLWHNLWTPQTLMIKSLPSSSSNNRIGEQSMDLSLVLKRSKFPLVKYLHFILLWRMLLPCIGNRKNLYYIIQPCQWPFRLVHFGSSFDIVQREQKVHFQRLEVVRRASGLGSTIAVFFPCGPYLCIVRAFGDLSVIKAWLILVSCLTNFNGLFFSCSVINWG